ncbi:thiopurine S-methyltransferase [Zhongshania sp.]|uniref:thiopurine S-methyltransferase n=1 Tax=Zhongshania sp. TaxID=1971902 RepID=UPI0035634A9F
MEASFWHKKWKSKDIAFHGSSPNPLLLRHFDMLRLDRGARVFLPLCGKTLDIGWLLEQGFSVVGAELSEIAVEELFAELCLIPQRSELGQLKRYRAAGLEIFVGDIFDLSAERLGMVDAVYDRAALVALPDNLRPAYTAMLKRVTNSAPQLLINYDYQQNDMPGPPFSISDVELSAHYDGEYHLTLLSSEAVLGGLKGQCAALEKVWLLQPRS